jgi:DNA gyrase subunit A
VVIRRTQYDLRKAKERAHILEGLIIACDNIDEVVHIIRAAKNPQDAVDGLMKRFELDDIQAKAIVEMRLRQLTGLMQDQLHAEYEEIERKIAYYEQILSDPELCKKVIKDELLEVKEKYNDPRRTEIKPLSEEFNPEDFYANDPMVITISHLGYIKRTPLAEFREQARGGVGQKAAKTRDQDFTEYIYPATMHNIMLFFTKKGRCYWLRVFDIPEGAKNSKGRAVQNILNIDADDSINATLRIDKQFLDEDFLDSHYIMFCTKNGIVKKTRLKEYSRPRMNGVNAINILEGDDVIAVRLTNGHNEILLANRNGRAIRFNEDQVRCMGRTATGVKGMTLDGGDDEVVGMVCVNDINEENIMVVSENGYGKRSAVDDYRKTSRGAKGVKTLSVTEKTGRLVAIKVVTDQNDLMIINKSGVLIRLKVSEVRVMGRATQGVRLINLSKKNDCIASVCKVMSATDEEIVEEENRKEIEENIASQQAPSSHADDADNADVNDSDSVDSADDEDTPIVDFGDDSDNNV